MRPYLSLVKIRFLALLQYRAAALAGVGTQLFWGLIRVMIFRGFYASAVNHIPMTRSDTMTYIWLGQTFFLLIPWNIDKEIISVIRTGNVAYEIVRPLDCYWYWFAKSLAFRTAPLMIRSIPLFLIAIPFLGMGLPPDIFSFTAFLISLIFAIILSSTITLLTTISLFRTISGEGIQRLVPSFMFFFCGLIVPLPLLPQWLQTTMAILPFRGIVDNPFRLYIGHIPYTDLPFILLHQVVWIIFFIVTGRFLLSRGLKRITIQGG